MAPALSSDQRQLDSPRQADAWGAPQRGGAAAGSSPIASPRRGLLHVDEGAEGVAPGKVEEGGGLSPNRAGNGEGGGAAGVVRRRELTGGRRRVP
jgi:hypothetical protein